MTQSQCVVVKCPDCLEARVRPQDVTLRHCLDDEAWAYRFTCADCGLPSVSPTGEQAARTAMEVGCPIEIWCLPAELLEHPDGPPFTLDNVLDLHEEMLEPDWQDRLARIGSDPT